MRTAVTVLAVTALLAVGCAGPERIAEGARRHEVAAQTARITGDYSRMAAAQSAANQQWIKACRRARALYGPSVAYAYCAYPR